MLFNFLRKIILKAPAYSLRTAQMGLDCRRFMTKIASFCLHFGCFWTQPPGRTPHINQLCDWSEFRGNVCTENAQKLHFVLTARFKQTKK